MCVYDRLHAGTGTPAEQYEHLLRLFKLVYGEREGKKGMRRMREETVEYKCFVCTIPITL